MPALEDPRSSVGSHMEGRPSRRPTGIEGWGEIGWLLPLAESTGTQEATIQLKRQAKIPLGSWALSTTPAWVILCLAPALALVRRRAPRVTVQIRQKRSKKVARTLGKLRTAKQWALGSAGFQPAVAGILPGTTCHAQLARHRCSPRSSSPSPSPRNPRRYPHPPKNRISSASQNNGQQGAQAPRLSPVAPRHRPSLSRDPRHRRKPHTFLGATENGLTGRRCFSRRASACLRDLRAPRGKN
jgi:hypothetical protein